MPHTFVRALRPALLASLVACAAQAQSRGALEGRVVDATTGAPIPAARLTRAGAARTFPADSLGRVRVEGLAPGTHRFRAEALGYNAAETTVVVGEGTSASHTFSLTPNPVELPGVVGRATAVSAAVRDIEARRERHRAGGRFITREQLNKREASTLATVLRSEVPGMRFVQGRGSETYAASTRSLRPGALRTGSGNVPCFVQIFVDGTKVFGHGSSPPPPPDLTMFFVQNLEGIEFYPNAASTPVELRNQSAACGTLVLWTRRG
jgi:hypothetical protein